MLKCKGEFMEDIIKILMERDGDTEEEAIDRIEEVKKMMEECDYDPDEVENIVMENLGLEMDYILDLLYS